MTAPPILFDRPALTRARNRTLRRGQDLFLHEALADEIQERLIEVNRTFTAPAVVSGFPDFWGKRFPDAKQVADNDRLDLGESQHDLVIHALCLHWANDPVGQLVQSRLALRPDGLLIAALFGGQTLQELRMALAEAETRVTGGLSPRVAPMGEIRDLGGLIQRAGLALPVADSVLRKLKPAGLMTPEAVLAAEDEAMRACGLSRPKIRYARAAAEAVRSGALDFAALPRLPVAEAAAKLPAITGIGPWTAEIYLMFCIGHADVFAPGDLALQEAAKMMLSLEARPDAKTMARLAEPWAPWRAVAARPLWAYYRVAKGREGVAG